jgi:sigma-B regulation protein RsbU (phosphoserine phosphatase)
MATAAKTRVLLCAGEDSAVADIRGTLAGNGHAVGFHPLAQPAPDDLRAHDLVVVEGGSREALSFCRRLRGGSLGDAVLPVLFVTADHDPAARLAGLDSGADACLLRPFAPGELLAQVRACLRTRELHHRLGEKTAEVHRANQRLELAHRRIDQELELARRLQQSFLPQALPEFPRSRFAVYYRPCGQVGGDFYDVFRLDEHHVGFYVADAMGHGVPASLLTIFIKKGVRAKEIFGRQYRLVPPDEVLQRLNRDLLEQGLADKPFITMVYGLLNHQTGGVQFARAGHPYPLHLPADGEPGSWKVDGTLLGVFETTYTTATRTLRPGDKLLFYTDGADAVSFEGHRPGTESVLACAARHRALPVGQFIERLAHDLTGEAAVVDDLTLLGLEMVSESGA